MTIKCMKPLSDMIDIPILINLLYLVTVYRLVFLVGLYRIMCFIKYLHKHFNVFMMMLAEGKISH